MSENCNHDCSSCSSKCESAEQKVNPNNHIDKVVGIVSGKGGVGKSIVTSLLAVELNRRGKKVSIIDADITGPSIPKAFGLNGRAEGSEMGILPSSTEKGIDVMSINLLLEDVTSPVVWRGPVLSGTVNQFWDEVVWGNRDVMLIDMPPGTGDVALTVFQSLPVDGIIIVTTPQELVSMIVEKAINMAKLMNIPILGIVENMSYFVCDKCNERHYIYGESHVAEVAEKYNIPLLAQLPFDKTLAKLCDSGNIESADTEKLTPAADMILQV